MTGNRADTADTRPRTVVVHHRNGIGDLIWHIPYLRAIAERSAGGKISLISRRSCRAPDVLAAETCIDQLIEFDRKPRFNEREGGHDSLRAQLRFAGELRQQRFQRIVIFSSRVRYAILALLAGIPQRAGFGFHPVHRLFLNCPPCIRPYSGPGNWVYPEATAFSIAQGFVGAPVVPRMAVLASELDAARSALAALPRPLIVFAIGASSARRNWGVPRFAALAGALVERGGGVVLLGGPAEADMAHAIIEQVAPPLRAGVLACAQGSIQRSAALLRLADRCVGNDTGALNMAVANGIPALGLFGESPPLLHDPLLQAISGIGMDGISVDAVLARLNEALAAMPAPLRPPATAARRSS
jgi:heptosyltransferase II